LLGHVDLVMICALSASGAIKDQYLLHPSMWDIGALRQFG